LWPSGETPTRDVAILGQITDFFNGLLRFLEDADKAFGNAVTL